ncbi:hypothetical protein GCM10023088_19630 [Actinomadura verrucosospora]|uniref:hypothetical protein n=1 Tax=Actinomadura verrucosospora TaxID=46165 RepID=UPI0031EA7E32
MTDFVFYRLLDIDPPLRKQWLLDNQPSNISPFHWWLSLVEAGVRDVRWQRAGWPLQRPAADMELAASLIEWALEQGFPLAHAVEDLVWLSLAALEAGDEIADLPEVLRPDGIARRVLGGFTMSRQEAVDRAAHLRSIPLTEDDFARPGEDIGAMLRALAQTDEYRDTHRLIDMQRALTGLAPIVGLIADTGLAAEVRAWLGVVPDLDSYGPDLAGPP